MRILLLGKYGQLGWELRRSLATLGEVVAMDYPEIDFTKIEPLCEQLKSLKPQVVVNAVAYTDVDKAEQEPELCNLINAAAPGALAEAACQTEAAFIHYSTDYVFDGAKGSPYSEADAAHPISAYGYSKWLGEQLVEKAGGSWLILRTSWMYSLRRDNYLKKVLHWARTRPVLRIVDDQVGSPTAARMLAEITAQTLALAKADVVEYFAQRKGLYHLAGEGAASRYEIAQEILRWDPHPEEQVVVEIQPASSSEFPAPARRPPNSALDCEKFAQTFGLRLPPWQKALQLTLEEN